MDGRQLGKPLPPKTVEVLKRLDEYTPTVRCLLLFLLHTSVHRTLRQLQQLSDAADAHSCCCRCQMSWCSTT